MFRSNQRREGMSAAIFGLWRDWSIGIGFLTFLAVIAPVTPRVWLAPINIVVFFVLLAIRKNLSQRGVPTCSRFLQEIATIVLILAVAMVLLSFTHGKSGLYEINGQPFDINSPFIGILITAPLTAIVGLAFLLRRGDPLGCQQCRMRYGNVIEHGFVGDLFRREWRYQTRLMITLCLMLAVVDWGYYLTRYINVNLNTADRFYFLWLPISIYALSLIYLGMRYYSLWTYYCKNDEGHYVEQPGSTTLRFLLINNDRIFLNIMPTEEKFENGAVIKRFDTPATFKIPYTDNENLGAAQRLFRDYTGISNAEIRSTYVSPDTVTYRNIFHYFAFIDDTETVADSKLEGEWFTLGNLHQLISQHLVGRDLVSEIRRIYSIAMAWKTYDKDGRRLYRIKHYRPTFRLRDIRGWDVDYNDANWLNVSCRNEDSRLYPVYRFFSKLAAAFSKRPSLNGK